MERTTLSTILQVLTLIISLVGAIGVLIVSEHRELIETERGSVQTAF